MPEPQWRLVACAVLVQGREQAVELPPADLRNGVVGSGEFVGHATKPRSVSTRLQDVREGWVACRPVLHAGFGRRRPDEGVGARQRAEARVALAGRVADVEGDEQVPGGIERVIHRSDGHRGVRWDGDARCDVDEIRRGVIGIAGRGGLGDGDSVERRGCPWLSRAGGCAPGCPAARSGWLNRWTRQTPSRPGLSIVSVPGGAVNAVVNASVVADAIADVADLTSWATSFWKPSTTMAETRYSCGVPSTRPGWENVVLAPRKISANVPPGIAMFQAELGRNRGSIGPRKVDPVDARRSGD